MPVVYDDSQRDTIAALCVEIKLARTTSSHRQRWASDVRSSVKCCVVSVLPNEPPETPLAHAVLQRKSTLAGGNERG